MKIAAKICIFISAFVIVLVVALLVSKDHETVLGGSTLPRIFPPSGIECAAPTNLDKMARQLIEQRNQMSRLLDETLQKLGQLQCEVASSEGEVSATGGWCKRYSGQTSSEHLTDVNLVPALVKFFRNKSVASFGDGPGEYKRLLDASGELREYAAYDGAPFADTSTNGTVTHLDLSVPQYGIPVYDWILSLEVAEHIPEQYERAFLDNIVRHAREGVVLSWAVPGQGGFHHVNLRPFEYVEGKFDELGFVHDPLTTSRLREACHLQWLRDNVNVFRRKEESPLYGYLA